VLKSHIDHCLETWLCVHNLQKGTIRQRQWDSLKAHDNVEEMVTAIVQVGEHVQTMGREVATVVFAEEIASVIAIW
jgi:hypothetical protein